MFHLAHYHHSLSLSLFLSLSLIISSPSLLPSFSSPYLPFHSLPLHPFRPVLSSQTANLLFSFPLLSFPSVSPNCPSRPCITCRMSRECVTKSLLLVCVYMYVCVCEEESVRRGKRRERKDTWRPKLESTAIHQLLLLTLIIRASTFHINRIAASPSPVTLSANSG